MTHRPYVRTTQSWKIWAGIVFVPFAVAACLLAPCHCRAADTVKPTQWKIPYQLLGLAWQTLSPKTGPIRQVGGQRLPIPFTLPPGLTPLGGKVQKVLLPPGSHWIAFTLFFPDDQNARLRSWLGNLPHQLPLNVRQYHVVTSPQVEDYHRNGRPALWNIHFVVQASAGKSYVRVVLDGQYFSAGTGQSSGPFTDDLMGRIIKSFIAPESPVRGPAAFEAVTIKYAYPNS